MISEPNIFQSETQMAALCRVAATRENFVGEKESGAVEPGSGRTDERANADRSTSSPAASPVQSTELAGGRVESNAAAAQFQTAATDGHGRARTDRDQLEHTGKMPVPLRQSDIAVATIRLAAIQAYRKLVADEKKDGVVVRKGMANRAAARKVDVRFHTLYNWMKAYDAKGFDGLLPKGKNSGRKRKIKLSRQETADVKALVLETNRTHESGSTPEALRVAIKRGLLAPDTAATIQQRFDNGQAPVTPALRNALRVPKTTTRADRGPRNEWLRSVQSPGSLMLDVDEETGEEYEIEPGMKWTMDDGTINLVCCVPFNLPGNKCSENFGVMVGRFQFLLVVDHRSYFIPGFNYTARPRSSYRAEDLTATLHMPFIEHGYPQRMVLEHGVSASKLLTDMLKMLDVKIERASSPHQKVVEFIFSTLWTKLSLLPGQVGRFMGEEEEIQALLGCCQRGTKDPRKYFPMLADVLKALHEAVTEWNAHLVISPQYGKWVPREMFDRFKSKNLRKLEPEQAWLFSPIITDPVTIQGFKARKTVCLMEGYSEVFDFSADWMHSFDRARVKLYFNPFAPECVAMVVLAENFPGHKAGEILGYAPQINRMTRFRRRALGYGTDPDIGRDAAARNAQALRQSSVAIRTDGSVGAQTHVARNGVGDAELATNVAPPPAPERRSEKLRRQAAGVDDEEFERQAARLAKAAERTPLTTDDTDDTD